MPLTTRQEEVLKVLRQGANLYPPDESKRYAFGGLEGCHGTIFRRTVEALRDKGAIKFVMHPLAMTPEWTPCDGADVWVAKEPSG